MRFLAETVALLLALIVLSALLEPEGTGARVGRFLAAVEAARPAEPAP